RIAGALGRDAKTFGKAHEIRIGEVAGDQSVVEAFLLDAAYIAESAISEDHAGERDAVMDGRGELGGREHEAAVTGDRNHGPLAQCVGQAESRRVAPAQRVLIAGRDERTRP